MLFSHDPSSIPPSIFHKINFYDFCHCTNLTHEGYRIYLQTAEHQAAATVTDCPLPKTMSTLFNCAQG